MARLIYTMPALDPYDAAGVKTRLVGIEQGQWDVLVREDGSSKDKIRLHRLRLAKVVAEKPLVVFEDLKRPDNNDGVCYCGKPLSDFRGPDIELPPPPNMVFCLFVLASGKMTSWRWEKCDASEASYPENWKTRFGRILWLPTQKT